MDRSQKIYKGFFIPLNTVIYQYKILFLIFNQLKKINNNFSNNSNNDEIENLKNKISQYEITLENTKNQYQKQINFYIEQMNNYNNLFSIISNFFQNLSNKFIPNFNINVQNNFNSKESNNIIQLNQKDLEEKFDRLEQYINELNSELNEYKNKNNLNIVNKDDKSSLDKNIDIDKNELDKFIIYNYNNNNINDSFPKTNKNYENIFS
jgi:hypothetical protein